MGERPCKDWSSFATNQGITRSQEKGLEQILLRCLQGSTDCETINFCCLSIQLVVLCYRSPSKVTHKEQNTSITFKAGSERKIERLQVGTNS